MTDDCISRCLALSARIDALAKMLDERRDRAEERFVSMDKAQEIATQSAKDAVGRLGELYSLQHRELIKQVEFNTGRLTQLEQTALTTANLRKQSGSGLHLWATIFGVIFATIISVITVAFNLISYLRRP